MAAIISGHFILLQQSESMRCIFKIKKPSRFWQDGPDFLIKSAEYFMNSPATR